MLTSKRYGLCLSVILTILPFLLKANEISFSRITGDISSNFVNCVAQTKDGFIWIGTRNGLQRYDGLRFRQIEQVGKGTSFAGLPIDQLLLTQKSRSLLVRMGHRFVLLNPRTFAFQETSIEKYSKGFQNYQIRLVQEDGNIFIILNGTDILVYNESKNKFESNQNIIHFPANWKPTWLQYDRNGKIWVSGINGMGYFDQKRKVFFTSGRDIQSNEKSDKLDMVNNIKNVVRFLIDSRGRFFIYTKTRHSSGDVFFVDPQTHQKKQVKCIPNPNTNYHDFYGFSEHNGMVWGYGLDVFNLFEEAEKNFGLFFTRENPDFGIQINTVSQIFKDRDDNLWVATDNGLYIMSIIDDHVRSLDTRQTFRNAAITDIAAIGPNRILASSWGERLANFAFDTALKFTVDVKMSAAIYKGAPAGDPNFNKIWAIERDPVTGNIWAGCQGGRLIMLNSKTLTSQFLVPKAFEGQAVRYIAPGTNGQMWFGADNGKVFRKTENGFDKIADLKSTISCIRMGRQNNIWIGTRGSGVFELDSRTGEIRRNYLSDKKGLSSSRISDIEIISNSMIAIAGYSGLDILSTSNNQIVQYNVSNGLPQNMVNSLVTDNDGMLWMSTIAGVCRFDPRSKEFRSFDKRSGLVSIDNSLNRGIKLDDGKIAFCGDRNILVFDPSKFNETSTPKKLHITDFKLFDSFLPVDSLLQNGGVTLEHWQNFFTISYSSLSYNDRENLKYYYRLEGSGNSWIRSESQLATTFASLPPKKYVFMIRSENRDGKFSDITRLPITIRPAFYQTWWFLTAIAVLAVGGIYLFHRYRLQRLLEVHRLREKVARDLHDDVGSTLTSINILSEVAKKDLQEDQTIVQNYLDRIGKNSSQMMQAMDDIVWSIKPDNDQLHKIVARMREHASSVLDPLQIQYSFEADESKRTIKLDMEQRRNLFLIFKETLNNISKYAEATQVHITIQGEASTIDLMVKDNGKGFDTSETQSGNGLLNMAQRSQVLGGQLMISSTLGIGTTVQLKLHL